MDNNNSAPLQTMESHGLFSGRASVFCYGRPHNWWGVISDDPLSLLALAEITKKRGIYKVWAPRVTACTAQVCQPKSFSESVLVNGVTLHTKHETGGVVIPQGGAFWLASADCPTIIAWSESTGHMIAAHAGRDCLLDRKRIETGMKSREHESIVDAIFETITHWNWRIPELQIFICCGISGNNFAHSVCDKKHSAFNILMIEDVVKRYGKDCIVGERNKGMLSLNALIQAQFIKRGVPIKNITTDSVDTFSDMENGEFKWWSARRGDAGRNGVLVLHY